jgi:HEAT repeat protein
MGDTRAVEPLIVALKDAESGVRKAAAEALGTLKDPRAVEPLIVALKGAESDVRKATAETLGKLKDLRAVESLIAVINDNYERGVYVTAAKALGEIGDVRATASIIAALEKHALTEIADALMIMGAPGVHALIKVMDSMSFAVTVLVKIGAPAVMPLITTLEDNGVNDGIRLRAARALGSIGDTRAVEPLIAALKDANEGVRQEVTEALAKLGVTSKKGKTTSKKDKLIASLIEELIKIGPNYIGTPGINYDEHHNHKRARQIGELLSEEGGFELMLKAHSTIVNKYDKTTGKMLESCWNGIDTWRG